AEDARKRVGRTDEIRKGLTGLGDIGCVAAFAAHQNVVLDARRAGRTAIRFCIHALFRGICLDQAHPLITETTASEGGLFRAFIAFCCRLTLRRSGTSSAGSRLGVLLESR